MYSLSALNGSVTSVVERNMVISKEIKTLINEKPFIMLDMKAGGIVLNRRERRECDKREMINTLAMEAYLVCPHCAHLTCWFHPWLISRSIDEGGGGLMLVVAIRKSTICLGNPRSIDVGRSTINGSHMY